MIISSSTASLLSLIFWNKAKLNINIDEDNNIEVVNKNKYIIGDGIKDNGGILINELCDITTLLLTYVNKSEIDEIIKLLQSKERLVYVDDGIEEAVIRYKDLPDFIVDYNEKCGLKDIKVYDYENPNMDKPLLDTFGVFLNKCEPKVREDIIYRLVMLQRGEIEVKDYKIIDEDTLDVANEKIEQEKMKKKHKERGAR